MHIGMGGVLLTVLTLNGIFTLLEIAAATTNLFDGGALPESVAQILRGFYSNSMNPILLKSHEDASVSDPNFSQEVNQHLPLKPLTPVQLTILTELKAIWDSTAAAQDSLYKKQLETVLNTVFKFVYSREPSEPDETLDQIRKVLKELRHRIGVTNPSELTPDQILQSSLKPIREENVGKIYEKQVLSIFKTLKSVIADHYARQLGQSIGEVEKVPMSEHGNLLSSNYQNLMSKLHGHYLYEPEHIESDVNDKTMEKIASVRDNFYPLLPSHQRQTIIQNAFLYPTTTTSPLTTPQPQTLLHTSLKLPAITTENSHNSYLNHKLGMPNLGDDTVDKNSVEQLASSIAQILYPLQSDHYPTKFYYHPAPEFGFPMSQNNINEELVSTQQTWPPNTDQLSTTAKSWESSYVPVQLLPTFQQQEDYSVTKHVSNAPSYEFSNTYDGITENMLLNSEFDNEALQNNDISNQLDESILKEEIIRNGNPTETMISDPSGVQISVAQPDSDMAGTEAVAASPSIPQFQFQVVQANPLVQIPTVVYNRTRSGLTQFLSTLSALPLTTKVVMVIGIIITIVSIMLSVVGSGSPVLAVGMLGFMIPISILLFAQDDRGRYKYRSRKQPENNLIVSSEDDIVDILRRITEQYYDELEA